jgi:Spy/CpxP family protein refolding chaperone
MKTVKKLSGVALAATAATLLSVAPLHVSAAGQDKAEGKCLGGNSCKGQSFCHTATSSCGGMNSCKGQGWIKATKAECEAKGGKIEE